MSYPKKTEQKPYKNRKSLFLSFKTLFLKRKKKPKTFFSKSKNSKIPPHRTVDELFIGLLAHLLDLMDGQDLSSKDSSAHSLEYSIRITT